MRTDYINNHKKSLPHLIQRWRDHLAPFFGATAKAVSVTAAKIKKYVEHRKLQGASNATINRELAALKRMFSLAVGDKVQMMPKFPDSLEERNIRKGFVSDEEYAGLAEACSKEGLWLRGMFETGYRLGWRVSELQDVKVSNVDLPNRSVRLEPETTKKRAYRCRPRSFQQNGQERRMQTLRTRCAHCKTKELALARFALGQPIL